VAALVVDQHERREVRQIDVVVVDEIGLQASVTDDRAAGQLRQRGDASVWVHGSRSFVPDCSVCF
jgi:hypothetical protein